MRCMPGGTMRRLGLGRSCWVEAPGPRAPREPEGTGEGGRGAGDPRCMALPPGIMPGELHGEMRCW